MQWVWMHCPLSVEYERQMGISKENDDEELCIEVRIHKCARLSVEGDPVGAVSIVGGLFAFGEDFVNVALGVSVPSVVPSCSHVQVDGVGDMALHQASDEELQGDDLLGLDEAQATVLFAQCPVPCPVFSHPLPPRGLLSLEDKQVLAKGHLAFRPLGEEFLFLHELPFVGEPSESACVGATTVPLVPFPAADMVVGDIGVSEGGEKLTGECRLAAEFHLGVTAVWHLSQCQVNRLEIGVIEGEMFRLGDFRGCRRQAHHDCRHCQCDAFYGRSFPLHIHFSKYNAKIVKYERNTKRINPFFPDGYIIGGKMD